MDYISDSIYFEKKINFIGANNQIRNLISILFFYNRKNKSNKKLKNRYKIF